MARYEKYSKEENIVSEYEATVKYWREKVVRNFKTGNEYVDIMANGWLMYQTLASRLFARTGLYQAGGAFGYRDQLQDSLALISSWPERTRAQIVKHATKQFEQGDVLHWWHEHNSRGIRTRFSDDYLWLPYVLSEYVFKTNDISVLFSISKTLLFNIVSNISNSLFNRFFLVSVIHYSWFVLLFFEAYYTTSLFLD